MIEVDIPGYKKLSLKYLVMDFNGTLAFDGKLIDAVAPRLRALAESIDLMVITADTFGHARQELAGLSCELVILPKGNHDQAKLDYVYSLGTDRTVCIGNGRNDRLMLQEAALGIVTIQGEGAAAESVANADIVCTDIRSALDLLLHPLRLKATLRS